MQDKTRQRALDLLAAADQALDRAAVARAERDMTGEPDALARWASSMPEKPELQHRSSADSIRSAPVNLALSNRVSNTELMALRHNVARLEREARAYRAGLEGAIGRVIRDQRKITDALAGQIAELREQLSARDATDLPALRLIGGQRG